MRFCLILLAAILLSACDDVKDALLPDSTGNDSISLEDKLRNLSEEERLLLARYLMRQELSKNFIADESQSSSPNLTAKTVGEAILQQKDFEERLRIKREKEKQLERFQIIVNR